MKKITFLLCLAFSFANICKAQTAAYIYLSADTASRVSIQNHVDGAFQSSYTWDNFEVVPSPAVKYLMELNDYSFAKFEFDGGVGCIAIAFENDSITLHFANDTVFEGGMLPENYPDILFHFGGANAAGQQYYNSKWLYTIDFISQLQTDVIESDDFSDFEERFAAKYVKPIEHDIDSMVQAALITPEFGKVLRREIVDYQYGNLLKTMRETPRNKKLNDLQTKQVSAIVDRVTEKFAKYDDDDDDISMRYRLGATYINDKYYYAYNKLNDVQKKELYGSHKPGAFGAYTHLLYAPENVRLASLFFAVLCEYKYGSMGFDPLDIPYVVEYMRTLAPESEAVEILTRLEKERLMKEASADSITLEYFDGAINSLSELSSIDQIKGNYCFIDLWASWCQPCLQEHQHAKELHDLVATYPNLKQVYITIDEPKVQKRWKSLVKKFELGGLNLMAGKELQKDIIEKIYQNKEISIPQYILLSPTGEVINANMPRPSQLQELKKALDKAIKTTIIF